LNLRLSWTERQALKVMGWKVNRMDSIKRWLPFIGTVITVVCAFLRAMGYVEAADAILGVVAFILPVTDTTTGALATTAAASSVGLVLQLVSRFNKAREKQDSITIPIR
jgi:hypothetical protein